MSEKDFAAFVQQLDNIIGACAKLGSGSGYESFSGTSPEDVQQMITRVRSAIVRISGSASAYSQQASEILSRKEWDIHKILYLLGVVKALKCDLEAGYMQSASELIHGEVFSDFLEMASHLLDEGYKDASAVIAGASLEEHLRQLCSKFSVDILLGGDGSKPKKSDSINADLAKTTAYSKLDQKNVTAWLDLRNNAAHGHYDAYTREQVGLMISGIRDFITRNPA